jgi:hypothetical protein
VSSQELVAHVCNPSYSGGRDEKDSISKPAWANSSQELILKIPITKWLVEQLKVKALSSSPRKARKENKSIKTSITKAFVTLALDFTPFLLRSCR